MPNQRNKGVRVEMPPEPELNAEVIPVPEAIRVPLPDSLRNKRTLRIPVPAVMRNKWVQVGTIVVVSVGAGYAIGHILGKRKLRKELDKLADSLVSDIDKARLKRSEAFKDQGTLFVDNKEGRVIDLDPDGAVKSEDIPESSVRRHPAGTITTREIIESLKKDVEIRKVNVFTNDDDDWDQEAELQNRDPNEPYIIHQDEFIEGDMGFRQETLTYYKTDDIMADAEDSPIYNYEGLMGELKFGHGSKDPNVVYIRNEKIHMEWEVLLHQGSFSEEVLGLEADKKVDADLKHSSVPRFRRE